ncbi:hypothetical protein Vretimale_15253 [Volvox reticuliferus]|uniref:Uncharacterized protein n=1 Tax=Volvox reticuliferus TaxID=1737510 RepID=A0A8J4C986_9CHLO|nr:hypothetical protein Vretifemale_5448 [Volvox reticuliferus]GIM11788.1 hypothetical protein Vretimale_15253 [Volvox reticuliferus]
MKLSSHWGCCLCLGRGGRTLRLACTAQRLVHITPKSAPIARDKEHLQRSLDVGAAFKQAPNFEYVAVAFRSQPRSKHRKGPQRDSGITFKHEGGLRKIFGETDGDHGYRTLELVSGDRRLLFEPVCGVNGANPASPKVVAGSSVVLGNDGESHGLLVATSERVHLPIPHKRGQARPKRQHPQLQMQRSRGHLCSCASGAVLTAPGSATQLGAPGSSDLVLRQSLPTPHGEPALAAHRAAARDTRGEPCQTSSPGALISMRTAATGHRIGTAVSGSSISHEQVLEVQSDPLQPEQQPQPQPDRELHVQHSRQLHIAKRRARRVAVAPGAYLTAAERLEAAAELLQLPSTELRRYRGFCSELRTLELSALAALCGVLVQVLGLSAPQLCAVLLRQPHVLRVPAGVLARRGAALALELKLPPPPGPGGGGPLATIVVAAPDVLLRRGDFAGTAAALAAALALPLTEALELLQREPQLLRHPSRFYALGMAQLREQLGLQPPAAVALAMAEPQLLAVSPSVLRENGTMLRSRLQLHPEQLAEIVARAPELLVRSPGALRAVVQRLTAVLSRSAAWREALPRLLASPRNLAVALSFGSDRYDRLEYLSATGRDCIMGFKEGLSLGDEEFKEVFPEYVYNAWRQAVPHTHAQPGLQSRSRKGS